MVKGTFFGSAVESIHCARNREQLIFLGLRILGLIIVTLENEIAGGINARTR